MHRNKCLKLRHFLSLADVSMETNSITWKFEVTFAFTQVYLVEVCVEQRVAADKLMTKLFKRSFSLSGIKLLNRYT